MDTNNEPTCFTSYYKGAMLQQWTFPDDKFHVNVFVGNWQLTPSGKSASFKSHRAAKGAVTRYRKLVPEGTQS